MPRARFVSSWLLPIPLLAASGCASKTSTTSPSSTASDPAERSSNANASPTAAGRDSEPEAASRSPGPLDRGAIEAIVAAEDREAGDREADLRRAPVDLLLFCEIAPGMKVADIGAGFGYTTELLARAVGPTGTVYGQNPAFVLERFAEEGWSARLAKPVMANVVRLDREFDDPLPPELRDLDLVVNVMFYHDFEWQGVDRAAHLAAVFRALRPGGTYVIVDHSAAAGAGVSGSKTLHRVEEALVRQELEAAGFRFEREADFLRNPDDTRDWNALPWQSGREVLSDRFVIAYRKPGPLSPNR